MSSFRPEANSHAVTPLTTMPIAATIITVLLGDRRRLGEPQDRLPGDRPDRQQEKDGVEQGGQDRRAAQAIGESGVGARLTSTLASHAAAEPEHVAEIVPRVGEQGDRVGDQAVGRLDRDEPDVERDADGEGRAEIRRRVGVIVSAMIVAVVMIVVVRRARFSLIAGSIGSS